jgi:DNA-binding NtrC family response regulator
MVVLIVDDEDVIIKAIKSAWKNTNLPKSELIIAENGKKAIEIVENKNVNIVILDLNLPDIYGVEIVKKIKNIRPCTKILMISGVGTIEKAVECIKSGASDFLEKPFTIKAFEEKISYLINEIKKDQEIEEYCFAKTLIEEKTGKQISSLEEALATIKECQQHVLNIIYSKELTDSEKLNIIKEKIENFKKRF